MTIMQYLKTSEARINLKQIEHNIINKYVKRCSLDDLLCDMECSGIDIDLHQFDQNRMQMNILANNNSFNNLVAKIYKLMSK